MLRRWSAGTGADDERLLKKADAIRRGIHVNQPDPEDGVDVSSKIGGFEIGGIAGGVLAGALVVQAICPEVVDYVFAGHRSEEPGHMAMLRHLGMEPILNLGMPLGEGTGGALAMRIMEGAVRLFNDMLTFEEAGVTNKES